MAAAGGGGANNLCFPELPLEFIASIVRDEATVAVGEGHNNYGVYTLTMAIDGVRRDVFLKIAKERGRTRGFHSPLVQNAIIVPACMAPFSPSFSRFIGWSSIQSAALSELVNDRRAGDGLALVQSAVGGKTMLHGQPQVPVSVSFTLAWALLQLSAFCINVRDAHGRNAMIAPTPVDLVFAGVDSTAVTTDTRRVYKSVEGTGEDVLIQRGEPIAILVDYDEWDIPRQLKLVAPENCVSVLDRHLTEQERANQRTECDSADKFSSYMDDKTSGGLAWKPRVAVKHRVNFLDVGANVAELMAAWHLQRAPGFGEWAATEPKFDSLFDETGRDKWLARAPAATPAPKLGDAAQLLLDLHRCAGPC